MDGRLLIWIDYSRIFNASAPSYNRLSSVPLFNLFLSFVVVVASIMGILERIKDIELELSRTQKNKATTTHIGMLKGQLARLRTQLMMPAPGSEGGGGGGFAVGQNLKFI